MRQLLVGILFALMGTGLMYSWYAGLRDGYIRTGRAGGVRRTRKDQPFYYSVAMVTACLLGGAFLGTGMLNLVWALR